MEEQPSSQSVGRHGEAIAAAYLSQIGYDLLEKNWRYKNHHEVDLIIKSPKEEIVAVEVRTHESPQTYKPFESIDFRKIARIKNALQIYANELDKERPLRVDVVSVVIETSEIEHFEAVNLYL